MGGGVFDGSAFSIRFGVASFFAFVSSFAPESGAGDSPSGIGLFLAPGVFAGSGGSPASAFLVCFCLEAAASTFSLDFSVADFAWAFGAGDSSGFGVGVFFAPDLLFGFEDSFDLAFFFRFELGVASLSFAPGFFVPGFALLFGAGDSSSPGVGLFLAARVAVGSGEGLLLAAGVAVPFALEGGRFLALRFAGFCFVAGFGVAAGVGEAAICRSSAA